MTCFPYGANKILIAAQVLSVLSLIIAADGLRFEWSFWIFGLFTTLMLLSMTFMVLDQSSIRAAAVLSFLGAVMQFLGPALAPELSTSSRAAGIITGFGWVLVGGMAFYLSSTLEANGKEEDTAVAAPHGRNANDVGEISFHDAREGSERDNMV